MGRRILALAHEAGLGIAGAVEFKGAPTIGQDAGELASVGNLGVSVSDDLAAVARGDAVAVDFSSPEATLPNLEIAAKAGMPIVVGTTGLSAADRARAEALAASMPTLMAPNMSLGVNVLLSLVKDAVTRIGDGFDCEVVEIHHNKKKDAPSGTALALAETAARARSLDPEKALVLTREGLVGERTGDEIGVVALRGGDNVGEHTVMLVGTGERIELTHRASSRDCLASGAVKAAAWLDGKPAGLYSMRDVIGLGS